MDWAQLSLHQSCGWEAGISALLGEAAAKGSRGTARTASGERVLIPTSNAVLPVVPASLPDAVPLVPVWPAHLCGKTGSMFWP